MAVRHLSQHLRSHRCWHQPEQFMARWEPCSHGHSQPHTSQSPPYGLQLQYRCLCQHSEISDLVQFQLLVFLLCICICPDSQGDQDPYCWLCRCGQALDQQLKLSPITALSQGCCCSQLLQVLVVSHPETIKFLISQHQRWGVWVHRVTPPPCSHSITLVVGSCEEICSMYHHQAAAAPCTGWFTEDVFNTHGWSCLLADEWLHGVCVCAHTHTQLGHSLTQDPAQGWMPSQGQSVLIISDD